MGKLILNSSSCSYKARQAWPWRNLQGLDCGIVFLWRFWLDLYWFYFGSKYKYEPCDVSWYFSFELLAQQNNVKHPHYEPPAHGDFISNSGSCIESVPPYSRSTWYKNVRKLARSQYILALPNYVCTYGNQVKTEWSFVAATFLSRRCYGCPFHTEALHTKKEISIPSVSKRQGYGQEVSICLFMEPITLSQPGIQTVKCHMFSHPFSLLSNVQRTGLSDNTVHEMKREGSQIN